MNTKITALTLAAATAFAFTPKPAVASNDGAAIFGAIVGGAIIGAAIASAHNDCPPVYTANTYCPPAPVVVAPAPVFVAPAPVVVADGYWTTVPVNVWVAPTWVVTTDYYGYTTRRYVAGHYECRNDRRWVAYNRHDNHGREVARGYGNDRYDNRHDNRRDDHRNDDRRDHR